MSGSRGPRLATFDIGGFPSAAPGAKTVTTCVTPPVALQRQNKRNLVILIVRVAVHSMGHTFSDDS